MSDREVRNAQILDAIKRAAERASIPRMDLNIKSVKCRACKIDVPYDWEKIELGISTCGLKDCGCGLQQNAEFIRRMEDKKNGLPKKLPLVLVHGIPSTTSERSYPPDKDLFREADKSMLSEVGFVSNDGSMKGTTTKTIEVDLPDPMTVTIDARGRVNIQYPK